MNINMTLGTALFFASLSFRFLTNVLHPAATPKPEEIFTNVFMAVRFDLRDKVTSKTTSGQGHKIRIA